MTPPIHVRFEAKRRDFLRFFSPKTVPVQARGVLGSIRSPPPRSDGDVANDTYCDGSMLVRVMASDATLTNLDGRPLPAVRYVNRLTFDLGQHTRHRPILGNNYVTARHPSSMPAIERLPLRRTVPGRRTVTFRPPSGSDIVQHDRPSVASERPRGARLGGKSVTDNRQGATVTSRMTHIATDPCLYESGRVMRRSQTSTDVRCPPSDM